MTNVDLFGNEIVEKTQLKNEFLVPPFSILDTQSGDWQNRKTKWGRLGIKSEVGRGAEAYTFHGVDTDANGLNEYGR